MQTSLVQLYLKQPVDHQGCIADHEMRDQMFSCPMSCRPCFKITLKQTKALFDLVALFADPQYLCCLIVQISGYRIESIILFFFADPILIQFVLVFCLSLLFDEPCDIVWSFLVFFGIQIF